MRQSQKTEQQADRLSRIGLENRKYTRARSTDYGEGKGMSVTIQDLVLDRNNLNQAYLRVKRNKGAAGVDDMTVNDLLPYLRENKTELIASLREGKYKPAPVKRVEIPKPNGGVRRLGIPTVVDRMVQQAVAQILTPIFERVFSDNSFGFRPHRGAHDAISKVVDLYNQGYRRVVDLDLKAYFDNVNHDLMIKYLQQYIDDPWTLRLIRKFLTSGVLDHGLFAKSEKGTPQGGPLSPLLANIYLNELD
ncbi:group II intron reverse transcriptase/maturase, partial [Lactobacillus reuteri]